MNARQQITVWDIVILFLIILALFGGTLDISDSEPLGRTIFAATLFLVMAGGVWLLKKVATR